MKRGFDLVTQADQARAVWHASYASIHTDHDDAACNLIFPPIYTSFQALLIELDDRYLALESTFQRIDMSSIPIPPVAYSLKQNDPYSSDSSLFYDKEKQ